MCTGHFFTAHFYTEFLHLHADGHDHSEFARSSCSSYAEPKYQTRSRSSEKRGARVEAHAVKKL